MIIIKDMNMPKNCDDCMFQTSGTYCCKISKEFKENFNLESRLEWCRLAEVSEGVKRV